MAALTREAPGPLSPLKEIEMPDWTEQQPGVNPRPEHDILPPEPPAAPPPPSLTVVELSEYDRMLIRDLTVVLQHLEAEMRTHHRA